MPSMDRLSWLLLSIGMILMAVTVALPIWFLTSTLSLDGSLSATLTHTDWSSLGSYLLLPVFSVVTLSEAKKSGRREWLREQARAGDERAMLPAAIKPSTTEQAEAAREPLELLWRTDRSSWTAAGMLLFLVMFITLATLAAMLEAAILASAGSLELSWDPLTICAAPVALELGLLGWWWSLRSKGPTGVVATEGGLRWLKAGRDKAFIPWSEARLFEVWRWRTNNQTSGYALSGGRTLIEWFDYSPDKAPVAADSASYEEMRRRQQALLHRIIERTGLTLRTCEPELALREDMDVTTAHPHNLISWFNLLSGSVYLLCIAGMPLIAAVGALVAPLTTTPLLNIYVAITMGPLGLTLLSVVIWALVSIVRNAPPPDVQHPDVKLPPAPPPGATLLGTSSPRTWRYNAVFLTIILLVAGELYALVRGFIDFILPMSVRPAWWEPHMFTIIALGGTSFIVGIIAIIGLLDKASRWFVDEQGVQLLRGKKATAIPLDMVAEIVISVEKGKVDSFKVIANDAPRTQIAWPAHVVLSGATPAPGESPGAVFAAAVAQRAGVTPRVEYE